MVVSFFYEDIMNSDPKIRLVTICNSSGKIMHSNHREGVQNLLSPEESKKSLCFFNLEKYEEAVECFDKTIEIDHNNVDALINKGHALIKLDKYEEAVECFDRVLDLQSNNSIALYKKGLCLLRLRRYEEAIAYCSKAIELEPNNVDALINKGDALVSLQKFNEGVRDFARVLLIVINRDILTYIS
jgi:tetratricopeptide (TPR) repeat protein